MIYNFPTVTAGQDLNSDIITTLAEHPIVGTKLFRGNIGKLQSITSRFSSLEFAFFLGAQITYLHGVLQVAQEPLLPR